METILFLQNEAENEIFCTSSLDPHCFRHEFAILCLLTPSEAVRRRQHPPVADEGGAAGGVGGGGVGQPGELALGRVAAVHYAAGRRREAAAAAGAAAAAAARAAARARAGDSANIRFHSF